MWGNFKDEFRGKFHQTDLMLASAVIGLVLLLIIPLPPFLLDLLLCLNIVFSVMVLLLTLYVEESLEFSSFPAALLFLTLYRLGLNIASTRMILTKGEAGDIIGTFGEFVTGGHVGVGLILFALLTTINFIVVTKGAGRVAEVAARFTLEALPGKQMVIDGELGNGLISVEEAKAAHKKIEREAEFYGAMDGASKFVRGDAVAGILMIGVNIIGGLSVGLFIKGMSVSQCWHLFTRLTVGDGLMSQLPALFVSVGAGIMVTRSSSQSLGKTLGKELFCHPKVLAITGFLLLVLGLIPGMPFIVMAPISALLLLYAWVQLKGSGDTTSKKAKQHYPIELELGPLLAGRVQEVENEIQDKLNGLQKRLGIKLPHCRIRDNVSLSPSAYVVKIRGVAATRARSDLCDLATKVQRAIASCSSEFICRQDVTKMIESARKIDAAVVNEVIGKKLNLGELLAILQTLLQEGVSIADFTTILESLADTFSKMEKPNHEVLTQKVRERLGRSISEDLFGNDKIAHTIRLDPNVEKMIEVSIQEQAVKTNDRLSPLVVEKITDQLSDFQREETMKGRKLVIVTEASIRFKIRKLIENRLPDLPVIAYSELTRDVKLETIGMVTKEVLLR